jgi:phosphoglycolate phosphatase
MVAISPLDSRGMLRDVSAVVFDLDGTLIDSFVDIVTHLNDALADHGLPQHSREDIGEWVGYGADELVRRAVPSEDLVEPVLQRYRVRYTARPVVDTRVFDGLDVVLDSLAKRYPLAVLTNKPHDLTLEVMDTLLSRWRFAAVHGQRAHLPRKPDPQALRNIAIELGVDVRSCVLVGDSEVDVATARSAGAPSIGVSWGLRPLSVLTEAAPDYLVHTPDEIRTIIEA